MYVHLAEWLFRHDYHGVQKIWLMAPKILRDIIKDIMVNGSIDFLRDLIIR